MTAWYFAFGSNLDPDRLRARVGDWSACRPAHLEGWRLRFSAVVSSEGGGGAVIEPAEGALVYGAVFAFTPEQFATMDAVELDPSHDAGAQGVRRTVTVVSEGEELCADLYTLRRCGPGRAPSEAYLGHILRGLRAAGHGPAAIEAIRATAESEPTDRDRPDPDGLTPA